MDGADPSTVNTQRSRTSRANDQDMDLNEPRLNLPELTVSELSAALKRTIEEAYGYVRVRGELGKVSYHGNGHVYFDLKDDRACDRRRDLAQRRPAHKTQARSRPRSGDHRPAHHLSGPLAISDRGGDAGARRPRRAHGAPGGAQEEARRGGAVRRGEKAALAVSAGFDRRHHLADRRRDPRYFAPARRPLSAPGAGLAGEGAGRGLGRRGRRRNRRLQRAAASAARRRCTPLRRCRRGPISSSSRAAAARWRICGRSTRRSWCARRRRASFR